MEKVAPEWHEVAVALGFDGARIKTIRMGTHHQPRQACLEMFTEWLGGGHDLKPPTWDALIHSIRAANLTDIADLLGRTNEIESAMSVVTESQVTSSIATASITNCKVVQAESSENKNSISHRIDSELAGPPQTDLEQGPKIGTMLDIQSLEVLEGCGGRNVRVIESIGSEWKEVAKALDMGQEDIDKIKSTHSDNDEEACRKMLATWLEGNNGEVSWTAFTLALIDAGLSELADSLKDVLGL